MLDLNELWVGDELVTASGKIGKFLGIASDKRARIDCQGKIFLVEASKLQLHTVVDSFPEHLLYDLLEDKLQASKKPVKIKVDHTIDLHIEKLAPHLINDFAGRIIEYQISRCKEFIEQAIQYRYPHITIIHGKGQGVLKTEVEILLQTYREAKFKVSKNDGGALDVWLG